MQIYINLAQENNVPVWISHKAQLKDKNKGRQNQKRELQK